MMIDDSQHEQTQSAADALVVTGERRMDFTPEEIWQAMLDPDNLQRAIPACNQVERLDQCHFIAGFKVNLGVLKRRMDADLSIDDSEAPHRYQLNCTMDAGFLGDATGRADVTLQPLQEGTQLNYTAYINPEGKLAKFGVSILSGVAARYVDGFFADIEAIMLAQRSTT